MGERLSLNIDVPEPTAGRGRRDADLCKGVAERDIPRGCAVGSPLSVLIVEEGGDVVTFRVAGASRRYGPGLGRRPKGKLASNGDKR